MAANNQTDRSVSGKSDVSRGMMAGAGQTSTPFGVADYKKLRVWRKAYALAMNADRVANDIRDADHKPLRSQLNRAAQSIPTNIVEGRAKQTDRDFARFLEYA